MSCFCIWSLEIIFCLCFGIIFFSSCPPLGCMLCTGVLSPGSHSRQPQIYQDCIGHDPLVKIKAFLYFCILLTNFSFCNCCPYCLFQVSSCEINVILYWPRSPCQNQSVFIFLYSVNQFFLLQLLSILSISSLKLRNKRDI